MLPALTLPKVKAQTLLQHNPRSHGADRSAAAADQGQSRSRAAGVSNRRRLLAQNAIFKSAKISRTRLVVGDRNRSRL